MGRCFILVQFNVAYFYHQLLGFVHLFLLHQSSVSLHAACQQLALHSDRSNVYLFLHCFAAWQAHSNFVKDVLGIPQSLSCTDLHQGYVTFL